MDAINFSCMDHKLIETLGRWFSRTEMRRFDIVINSFRSVCVALKTRNTSSERRRERRMNTNELFEKSADIKILFLKSESRFMYILLRPDATFLSAC